MGPWLDIFPKSKPSNLKNKLTELPVVLHPESILHKHNSVLDHQHVEEEDKVGEVVRDEP